MILLNIGTLINIIDYGCLNLYIYILYIFALNIFRMYFKLDQYSHNIVYSIREISNKNQISILILLL